MHFFFTPPFVEYIIGPTASPMKKKCIASLIAYFFIRKIMDSSKEKRKMRMVRHRRVRSRVFGVADKPRLCVFRSNKNLSAQVIDDVSGKVLASAWTKEITQGNASTKSGVKKSASGAKHSRKMARQDSTSAANNIASAEALGTAIAKKAAEKKIKEVVFDRGGYAYHGKIKAFAEGARKGGLIF